MVRSIYGCSRSTNRFCRDEWRTIETLYVQPLHTISEAHQADVWDVQLASSTHGELLNCPPMARLRCGSQRTHQ